MELRAHKWKPGTDEIVTHDVLAEYIQDTAQHNDLESAIQFNVRVDQLEKVGSQWNVHTSKLLTTEGKDRVDHSVHQFDAVVVASGHYHACNVPDIAGLQEWKRRWPDRIFHSKGYRNPEKFRDQNVLLVGAGVSSTDIARELGTIAKTTYQVSRGGAFDLPTSMLPENAIRIDEISSFEKVPGSYNLAASDPLPGTVTLKSGRKICGIHQVVLCTGYHMSYPFLRTLHADDVQPQNADETVLVTADGQQTHNLHKDIFYIPDPTLSFIGVPYHVATFSLFEFQAIALAAVYSGQAQLPNEQEMRRAYNERIARVGAGRGFHSLRGDGNEDGYVNELTELANQQRADNDRIEGHSLKWHEAYARRVVKLQALRRTAESTLSEADVDAQEALWQSLGPCV
ncbi:hypothetical protein MBLNU459_g1236t1 [Dothideomycetes sp. NU459]